MTAPMAPTASIDLKAPGKRIGHIELVWSDDVHAYGVIPVPIVAIVGGDGPTALVTAGVHGDEYEGLVIARSLAARLEPGDLAGRLIVMPALNWPAVEARARTSPIDRQNLNRAFPGGSEGPTALIAAFVEGLLPEIDIAIDLHSGGTQSIYTPCGYVYAMGPRAFRARKLAAAHAFGAPVTAVVAATASSGSLSGACERHGVPMVATELGGGARLDRAAQAIGEAGTLNLLRHAGVLHGTAIATRTSFRHTPSRRDHVMAPIDGLAETVVAPGDIVEAGQLVARVWPTDDLARPPVEVRFAEAGMVMAVRTMPMVRRGDTLCHTGIPMSDDEFLGVDR